MPQADASGITGQLDIIKAKYAWVIDDFCISCKNVGESYRSPIFSIHGKTGYKFQIILDPKSETDQNFVSIFLELIRIRSAVKITYEFSVLNDRKEKVMETRKLGKSVFTAGDSRTDIWVFPKFIERHILPLH